MDLSVILPTFNESGNICELLCELEKIIGRLNLQSEIIVVDDNSPDGTGRIVREYHPMEGVDIHCIVRTKEKGLATAIRDGILYSSGSQIVVMDTDFNHPPAMLTQMVQLLEFYDLVIGSRFVHGGGMEERSRYYFSLAYNWFVRLILWHQIHDSLSGFFAIHREKLLSLDLEEICKGYGEYFIRLTYRAARSGYRILEVPVFYTLRKAGVSKSNFGKMIINYTFCALYERFERK